MSDEFDMTQVWENQRRMEEQMLKASADKIKFDCAMDLMHAASMIANFNLQCFVYASLNPNLSQEDLIKLYGEPK